MKKLLKTAQKGFTLIELLVVIAILGVLATVLLVLIDPVDKINLTNDTGVINTFTQLGRANDSFATQRSNGYSSGKGTATCVLGTLAAGATNNFSGLLHDLCSTGEIKYSSVTNPGSNYTFYYFATPGTCTNAANDCSNSLIAVGTLMAKKYSRVSAVNGQYFIYTGGKGCVVTNAAAPTAASVGVAAWICP